MMIRVAVRVIFTRFGGTGPLKYKLLTVFQPQFVLSDFVLRFEQSFTKIPLMKNITLALFASLLVLSSCSGLKVTQHYDEEIDFTQHKSFFLMPPDPFIDLYINQYDKELLLRSIADELKARGYKQNEATGDLAVNIFLVMNDKTGFTNYNNYYHLSGYRFVYTWGYGSGAFYQYTIKKGTLIIDVFDNRSKKLAWQVVGIGTVEEDPLKRTKNIPHVIQKMFYKYPVKKK